MWDKWKRKIQNFIWKEENEEEQKNHTNDSSTSHLIDKNQHIPTKMVYQYPKKQQFPFPAIPDKPTTPRKKDMPAYKRRESQVNPQMKKEITKEHKSPVYESSEKSKVKKQDNKPFKPSRVASPIYGYQKRHQNEEIQKVPAYLRKQNSQVEKEALKEKENKSIPGKIPASEPSNLEDMGTSVTNENEVISRDRKTEDKQHEAVNLKEKTKSTIPASFDKPKEDNSGVERSWDYREQATIPSLKTEKDHRSTSNERKAKKASHSPFNVIMTPRDKKKLLEKQRNQEGKEQVAVTTMNSNRENVREEREEREVFPNYLLDDPVSQNETNHIWVEEQKGLLEKTLKHFNVQAQVVNATQGPSVTRFEVKPELGVKVSRIRNLSDDLKLNMAAKDIRIEAPIPGKNTVGIEVPNPTAEKVGLQEIFETDTFQKNQSSLAVALGLDIEGNSIVTDLQKMPHGLIAGATGSGKSVCINTILISLLYKSSHEDVRLLLIDPKMVELTQYNGIPHLVSPVITDVKAATAALKWAVQEMETRYEKFVQEGVRDIKKYNQKAGKQGEEKMPFLVIVIDELADLMMISPQDVEDSISRIAQKARACGIHLLLATQRPSVDVITGLIKANIPTRIAFSVSSQVDSRTILDVGGAEKLLGKGDMLFIENGAGKSVRLQGAFVSDEEIDRVTDYARKIASPDYLFEQETLLEEMTMIEEEDDLMQDVIDFVMRQNGASTSLLQRNFKIGYNRAARLIDSLEQKGIVSGQNGSKPRDVLMTQSQIDELIHHE